ncbi:MAG: putative toxin-antitoxin system toxin component, PIN family [Defluviicoccus sp.]|nr:putative toxin-antitoxin system toxin component, PIN family [Defluviicoccus sp.]MDE0274866.1 putative toxin-antitoxin system toxin component, PIN family [Defluviicoccus sp.]
MRLVLDTNILIGALITKGTPPDELYRAWLRGDIELVTSAAQIAELAEVLARPRIRRLVDADEANAILENLAVRALVLNDLPAVDLSPDPSDNPILAAAIAGNADFVVSGDKKHVLSLGEVDGIPVVTARDVLRGLSLFVGLNRP